MLERERAVGGEKEGDREREKKRETGNREIEN